MYDYAKINTPRLASLNLQSNLMENIDYKSLIS